MASGYQPPKLHWFRDAKHPEHWSYLWPVVGKMLRTVATLRSIVTETVSIGGALLAKATGLSKEAAPEGLKYETISFGKDEPEQPDPARTHESLPDQTPSDRARSGKELSDEEAIERMQEVIKERDGVMAMSTSSRDPKEAFAYAAALGDTGFMPKGEVRTRPDDDPVRAAEWDSDAAIAGKYIDAALDHHRASWDHAAEQRSQGANLGRETQAATPTRGL